MSYLYENLDLLMYLRYNPRWYKILYYDPSMFNAFINEAKENLKIRGIDKLEVFKNRVNLAYGLASLFKNK
ncbi:MAG: YlbE-like family protein [Anaeroplasma sp.]